MFKRKFSIVFLPFLFLFISSCDVGIDSFSAKLQKNYGSSVEIWNNPKYSKSTINDIQAIASDACYRNGYDLYQYISTTDYAGSDVYTYICKNNIPAVEKPKKQNVIKKDNNNISSAKKSCSDLGIEENTEKFADCVLQLSK